MNTRPTCSPDWRTPERTAVQTLRTALESATRTLHASSDTARLDAEVLLARVLGKNRAYLRAWPERLLTEDEKRDLLDLVARRTLGIPIAYLTGEREFWSRPFRVSPEVLIPRPETELLVELAIAAAECNGYRRILDLGTGSGAIAITLALECPYAEVWAVDISEQSLAVAGHNAATLGAANVRFLQGNWLSALPADLRFGLIVSNPPYIDEADPHLSVGDVRYEPRHALVSASNGLHDIARIAEETRNALLSGGHLMFEHGFEQAPAAERILDKLGYSEIRTHRDLQGHQRVTEARYNPS